MSRVWPILGCLFLAAAGDPRIFRRAVCVSSDRHSSRRKPCASLLRSATRPVQLGSKKSSDSAAASRAVSNFNSPGRAAWDPGRTVSPSCFRIAARMRSAARGRPADSPWVTYSAMAGRQEFRRASRSSSIPIRNPDLQDPSDNYIAVCTAGTPRQMHWPPPRLAYTRKLPVKLKDGKVHMARIAYQPPILTVTLDGQAVLTSTVDLSSVVDRDGAAYVGFTASTGNGFENHDILTWSLRPDVSSTMSVVSSSIVFLKTPCLPDRNLCTPERAQVEGTGSGTYHVVLPANLPWGASIPNPLGCRWWSTTHKGRCAGIWAGSGRKAATVRRQSGGSRRARPANPQRAHRVFGGRPHRELQRQRRLFRIRCTVSITAADRPSLTRSVIITP